MARLDANLSETQEWGTYQPLPPDDYEVTIVNSEIRATRNGDQQVVFIYEVATGPHAGAQVFDRLPLWNADPKISGIAQRKLKSIAIACGLPNPNYISDTSELHGRRMITTLGIRQYNGSDYQQVKAYLPCKAQAKGAQAVVPPPAARDVHATKPWE